MPKSIALSPSTFDNVFISKNKNCNEILVLGFPSLDPAKSIILVPCVCCNFTLTKKFKGIKPPETYEPRYLDYNIYSIAGACGSCLWAPCLDPCCSAKKPRPCVECCCLTCSAPPCCWPGCRGLTCDFGLGACKRCGCVACSPDVCTVGCSGIPCCAACGCGGGDEGGRTCKIEPSCFESCCVTCCGKCGCGGGGGGSPEEQAEKVKQCNLKFNMCWNFCLGGDCW